MKTHTRSISNDRNQEEKNSNCLVGLKGFVGVNYALMAGVAYGVKDPEAIYYKHAAMWWGSKAGLTWRVLREERN
ncbi:MAG: hypothetical protein ABIB47_03370 [Candidatus Woesearchaeota archaeon]